MDFHNILVPATSRKKCVIIDVLVYPLTVSLKARLCSGSQTKVSLDELDLAKRNVLHEKKRLSDKWATDRMLIYRASCKSEG